MPSYRPLSQQRDRKQRNQDRRDYKRAKLAYYQSAAYLKLAAENRKRNSAHKGRRNIKLGRSLTDLQFAALGPARQAEALQLGLYGIASSSIVR
jgi:hypothetical protein